VNSSKFYAFLLSRPLGCFDLVARVALLFEPSVPEFCSTSALRCFVIYTSQIMRERVGSEGSLGA
jgi:hypothetical protein